MKIVFLNLYSGKIERGAESQAHQLAEQLREKYKVTFLKGNSAKVSQHQFAGNLFQRWFNRKRWFVDEAGLAILGFTLKQIPILLKQKPDWVIPMNGFWQVLLLKLLQPFVGWKILIVGHSGPGWDERWNLYLKPTVFVASTKPTLEWARSICTWTTSVLIPYGINPEDFKATRSNRTVFKPLKNPIVLCPSALVDYKRVDLAIQAVAKTKDLSLVVLGKGPLKKELQQLGKKLLGNDRFLLTSLSYDQMPSAYTQADVITLPSSPQENSPMVYVEALAAGKPVVATDAPRVKWTLESHGMYVDPTNIDQYTVALTTASLQKQDKPRALDKFTWLKVKKQYTKVLESL